MRYPGFVPTINLRLPVLSLTLFAHCYPSQTLLWLKIYQKLFSTHMHNWLLLYICRKNTYQSAVIRSISQCLAPKFASCPSVKTRRSHDVDSRPSDKTRRVIYVDSRPSDNTCRVFDVDSHPSDKTGRVIDVDSRPSDKSCHTNDVDSLSSDDTRRVIDDHSRPSHQVEDGSPCDVSSAVSSGLTAEEYNRVFVCGSPRVSNSANACRKNQDVDLEPSDTIVVVVNPAAAASGGPKSKSPLESARPARPTRTMAEVVADPPKYQYVTRQRSRRVRTSSLVTAETKAQPSSRKVNNSIHIIGSGERRLSGGIQAAPRRGRESRTGGLFVSRLAPSTSASALRRHIKDSCDVTVTCVSIKTKFDSYCSFRVRQTSSGF